MAEASGTFRPLEFYLDYISHNAYLAWERIGTLAARYRVEVEPVPVLFAGLLNASGQKGPAEIPAKLRWMNKDVIRKAARLGIPLQPPASHPFNPLLPLRVSCIEMPGEARARLVSALFRATWADSLDVSQPAVVAEVLEQAGLAGERVVEQAGAAATKARLRENTEAALAAGVFGVPSMRVGDEVFWGFDDFGHLEAYLAGEEPPSAADLAAWSRVRPTAARIRREE